MKSRITLLLIILVSSGFDLYGQGYQSIFGKESTSWNIHKEDFDIDYWYSIYTTGDSLIGSYNYKKIDEYQFVREDTLTGKVWARDSYVNDTTEYLVVDLSLQLGDSFLFDNADNWLDTLVIVDSVYFLNNLKHIRFNYKIRNYGSKPKLLFIEGTGSNVGFFNWENDNFIDYLLCAYKDGVQSYSNQLFNGNCQFNYGGLSEKLNTVNYNIYPNPFNSSATFSLDIPALQSYQLILYNIWGKPVRTIEHINTSDLVIRKQDLPNGPYFFSVYSEEKVIVTGKLLIEQD
jgi:hypothetical protein